VPPLTFREFFKEATGHPPFPYQERMATEGEFPSLVHVPTGAGKTAAAVLGWLWRRRYADDGVRGGTPRRLIYCLPMRVLVEQTRDNAKDWLRNLGLLAENPADASPVEGWASRQARSDPGKRVAVTVVMGGEAPEDWDVYPEREAIIIGTQDMLLSRALNRGYAMSRARWPMQFGLLHTDSLWIFDEIQLMGTGLATTTQLEGFRHLLGEKDGHGCRSVWMSATMQRDWLATVDFRGRVDALSPVRLDQDDHRNEEVERRWRAKKPLQRADSRIGDAPGLASEILKLHKPGTRTIVVLNTVRRACELFESLSKGTEASNSKGKRRKIEKVEPGESRDAVTGSKPSLTLLHSRFRPRDRKAASEAALADIDPNGPGAIVVSTQVIEAGVDVSATTLFTELAPWASLVQRFGRCNRLGKENDVARALWIDLPDSKDINIARPYELDHVVEASVRLKECENGVGPSDLPGAELPYRHSHVIRRKDLIDLFDTTLDLAGNDIDIDRFVRDVEGSDVRVFWREWSQPKGHEAPSEKEPVVRREEICPAPLGDLREFAKEHPGRLWRWSFLEDRWEKADAARIAPGQVFLLHAEVGGYTPERGWDGESKPRVEPISAASGKPGRPSDADEKDGSSHIGVWQTIAEHADETCRELDTLIPNLQFANGETDALRAAARWHDRGKAHVVFQRALPDGAPRKEALWAKAAGSWKRYERRHFRHELASALAVLDPRQGLVPNESRDLIAYLVAAHHGKVRTSIRSLPEEFRPDRRDLDEREEIPFARGVWDGDTLPATDLGGSVTAPTVTLSLEPMELGLCERGPFVGQPSWTERVIRLRETHGPFRLAYLEAILRAADWRASAAAVARVRSLRREAAGG
jgi:CRISPR-associated endonuclease/helicase Cas3